MNATFTNNRLCVSDTQDPRADSVNRRFASPFLQAAKPPERHVRRSAPAGGPSLNSGGSVSRPPGLIQRDQDVDCDVNSRHTLHGGRVQENLQMWECKLTKRRGDQFPMWLNADVI